MKTLLKPIAFAVISSLLPVTAKDEPKKIEGFEEGMRQAFADYKKGDNEAVTAKLRELLKLMEEQGAAKVGTVLPDAVDAWKGESLKKDDIAALGGGVSLSRIYVSGEHRITAKVVKDSPMVTQLLPLFANEDLIRMTNRKTHHIGGETAIMEGENKLQIVVDGRIFVELEGDKATGETELVAFARKLDLAALAKMK
jgi:hypothetical protein